MPTPPGEVVNFWPYILGYCTLELERKRFGTYRFITILALYDKINMRGKLSELAINPLHEMQLRKRLEEYPRFNSIPLDQLGRVYQFPNKIKAIEHHDITSEHPE